ncbi:hypothetical protein [Mesorhizobium sp. CAU 1741]|uniref:hypothetical protein n=1 Tax=Mesorhizobium sp. CAU 1741 TaxID=3140366 RepID=UPI00325AB650
MLKITNVSSTAQRFTAKDGKRVEIQPGQVQTIAADRADKRLKGKERAGLIRVEEQRASRKKPSPPAPVSPADETPTHTE